MMTTFSNETTQAILEDRLRRATSSETQRVLCLWLCLVLNLTNTEVSKLLGVSVRYVRNLRAKASTSGLDALDETHGGNRKALPRAQELSLLLGYLSRWKQEKLSLSTLRKDYETTLGKKISDSAFRRFLVRYSIQYTVLDGG